MEPTPKPIVLITGAAGSLGSALRAHLQDQYEIVGTDRPGGDCDLEMDLSSKEAIETAISQFKERYGSHIAAVIHLAAYFDFTGEPSDLYEKVNERGTHHLVKALQELEVERFIYASTMLVHKPGRPGDVIDESTPIDPQWAYPQSKAKTEEVIREHHGSMPFAILRLAGLYSEESAVPTLAQQIARIYERNLKSVVYAGSLDAGQAMLHQDDMLDLFARVIERRQSLPNEFYALAGEPDVLSYEQLQDAIGLHIYGDAHWRTINVPKPLAKAGAWIEEHAEPVIPDTWDEGEKPFIRPFMIDLASQHYALDIGYAEKTLGWRPQKRLAEVLPQMIKTFLQDPQRWYKAHKIHEPVWMESADEQNRNSQELRRDYEDRYQTQHRASVWAHFLNLGLAAWLVTAPFTLGYESRAMVISDVVSGILVLILGSIALSPRPWLRISRWGVATVGFWLLWAPLIFWAPTSAAYMNGTLIGALLIGFAILVRPAPGLQPTTALTGPTIPPGWDFSPSDWFQRIPIIVLAFVGFFISRYMAAYQLGHIDAVWDPFFSGVEQPQKNGTEDIITSSVSEAWPVPDSGLGALTYMLEIITGLLGSRQRWRTMPWLVILFGFMIIPLGAVSVFFIIIQPIMLSTWCTLCLIAAAAMLLQIPYSFDEIVATVQFLRRRAKAGRPWLKIIFTGDTDIASDADKHLTEEDFNQPFGATMKEMVGGGVNFPWSLMVCAVIGLGLMLSRVALGADGNIAHAHHLLGALVLSVTITALAEVTRPARLLNIPLGLALIAAVFMYDASTMVSIVSVLAGVALTVLSIPRGAIRCRYNDWNRVLMKF